MTVYAYIRVSTIEQNETRQIKTMLAEGVQRANIYVDKASGANLERPNYRKLKAQVRRGDTIIFDSITRLSRTYRDVRDEYEYYRENGVLLRFIREPMLNTPTGGYDDVMSIAIADVIMTILAAFADKERENIRIQQAQGIAIAKQKGKYRGRKTKLVEGGEEEARRDAIINAYKSGTSIADIRKTYRVGTGTIYRLLEREGIKR